MSEVEIVLGSGDTAKTETLVCSPRAAKRVNTLGGMAETLRRLAVFDMDAYTVVIAAGLNKNPESVENSVYSAGLVDLLEPLSTYVKLLANGGRPLKTESDTPGEA